MLNLTLISNSINLFIVLLVALKIFLLYRRYRSVHLGRLFWDFSVAYFMLAGYFAVIVISQALFSDLRIVGFFAAFTHFFLAMTIAYFLMLVTDLYRREDLRTIVFLTLLLIGSATVIFNLFDFRPSVIEIHQGFVFQRGDLPIGARLSDSLITIGGGLFTAFFFLRHGRTSQDPIVRKRSLLMGIGMVLIVISAVLAFFVTAFIPSALITFLSSLNVIPGLLLILAGILYRYRKLSE